MSDRTNAGSKPASGEKKPSAPLPAATIMLLRDGSQGLEVFMVVRHHQIDFASGALVFPGGKVDQQDSDERVLARIPSYSGATAGQSTLRVAAIREAFEESGILLARHRDGSPMLGTGSAALRTQWRRGLNDRSLALGAMLEQGDLTLACDELAHFSHWITPAVVPKRFDTHFYLARVPAEQIAGHDGHENVDSVWIRPQQVVDDARDKKRTVIFPTLSNITRLAQWASVDEAFERVGADPIRPILPVVETRADGRWVSIPKDAGFPLYEYHASLPAG